MQHVFSSKDVDLLTGTTLTSPLCFFRPRGLLPGFGLTRCFNGDVNSLAVTTGVTSQDDSSATFQEVAHQHGLGPPECITLAGSSAEPQDQGVGVTLWWGVGDMGT